MNLGLGFLVLALHLPTGAKLNVLDISVCEQMDIVTNLPLRLLVRFVLSFPLWVTPFSKFALAYPKWSSGKAPPFSGRTALGKIITRATTTN
jgi:hypothetical protein